MRHDAAASKPDAIKMLLLRLSEHEKNTLRIASHVMFGAEDPRALGENMAHRRFRLFDATTHAEKMALHAHGIERCFGLVSEEVSCEFDGIVGDLLRVFKTAQTIECDTHRLPAVHVNSRKPTRFHSRLDSRQNVERVSRAIRANLGDSPRDFYRQHG
mmetsp:Transcript_3741/g.14676  ORF Transcript_3741/g.14676 Transcript_3741/m.14676 type:complete len:158 (+) Transcript_3741:1688-2161(+)